jgi:hypothetical protein
VRGGRTAETTPIAVIAAAHRKVPSKAWARPVGVRSAAAMRRARTTAISALPSVPPVRQDLRRIADEAGVVRLTIYRRYRNRDALRRAIFEAAAVEARAVIADATERDLDPVAALRALIVEMAAIIQRYPLLAVADEWQPKPDDPHRPSPPPASRGMHPA